jgi:hypothetical protein
MLVETETRLLGLTLVSPIVMPAKAGIHDFLERMEQAIFRHRLEVVDAGLRRHDG